LFVNDLFALPKQERAINNKIKDKIINEILASHHNEINLFKERGLFHIDTYAYDYMNDNNTDLNIINIS